jgi:type IV pilus assembly protein PilQ
MIRRLKMKLTINRLITRAFYAFTTIALAAVSAAVFAQNSIESVNVSTQSGGTLVVKVTLKNPMTAPPAGFTVNNPPRVAFDFPNTSNASGRNVQEHTSGDLRRINLVQSGGRTRMVLELTRALNYETQMDGKSVLITLQGGAATTASSDQTQQFAPAAATDQQHSVRNVDFRRGDAGAGRVVIDLSSSQTGIDIKRQGRSIVVDFVNAALPKNLARRYDVTDFGTPVRSVEAFTQGSNARVIINPSGNWEHSAYQADNRFIVEVKRVIEDKTRLVRPGFVGEKLSLNFQSVEVRSVLQVLADFTGLNIITSDTVTGSLTLRLKDVPWDQALDIILRSKGLDMRKDGNVVWIAPRDELATREKLALEASSQITDLEPTRTEGFQLNYSKAAEVQTLLTSSAQKVLSKRGSAVVDTRTNMVFVQDTPSRLEEVRRLILTIDVPVRQVMIESRIVEASDTFARNLGVRMGLIELGKGRTSANLGNVFGAELSNTGQALGVVTGTPVINGPGLQVNLPASSIGAIPAAQFTTILFNRNRSRLLSLELSALQADGKGKIISSPRVITANQQEATIEQGTEIPYSQSTSSGATSVSFKKATLKLNVKPQITPDENVIMTLKINKDSVGAFVPTTGGGSVPSIDTKQVTTEVLVENGGTVVIGGIYTQQENTSTTKIPVLGDLPYVGFLFRNNLKSDNRGELLVFISPRILKDNLNLR